MAGAQGPFYFLAGKQLVVENTTIAGVTGHGIDVALSATGKLTVRDPGIRDCGGAGINIGANGTPTVSIDNTSTSNCGSGLVAATGSTMVSECGL